MIVTLLLPYSTETFWRKVEAVDVVARLRRMFTSVGPRRRRSPAESSAQLLFSGAREGLIVDYWMSASIIVCHVPDCRAYFEVATSQIYRRAEIVEKNVLHVLRK